MKRWDKYWQNYFNRWSIPIEMGILDRWCLDTESDVNFIESIIKRDKSLRILDISCGWGRHVLELKKRGYNVIGLDYSFQLLNIAKTTGMNKNLSVPLVCVDRNRLWWVETFDVILQMYDAPWTEYWKPADDHSIFLQRIYQALKPGGYYITGTTDYMFSFEKTLEKEKKSLEKEGLQLLENLVSSNKFTYHSYDNIHGLLDASLFAIQKEYNTYNTNQEFDPALDGYVLVTRALKTTVEIWVFTRTPGIEVLLLRRKLQSGWGKIFWQPITGTLNFNESPHEAAIRELQEESGYTTWENWYNMDKPIHFFANGLGTIHKTIYAVEVKKQPVILDSHEHDDFKWVSLEDVPAVLYWDSNIEAFQIFKEFLSKNIL